MARPQIEIDQKQFEKLCKLQCTQTEIASYFGCSVDTIDRWCKREYELSFAEVFREKREAGHVSLRRLQWQHAEKNAGMAMFLGKQYLGQRDNLAVETTHQFSAIEQIARSLFGVEEPKEQTDELS